MNGTKSEVGTVFAHYLFSNLTILLYVCNSNSAKSEVTVFANTYLPENCIVNIEGVTELLNGTTCCENMVTLSPSIHKNATLHFQLLTTLLCVNESFNNVSCLNIR